MDRALLLIPGLWNSGPEHWQSYWERSLPNCRRVVQRDWETPRRTDWLETLDLAIAATRAPVVLAAHSLGCCLVAHWAAFTSSASRVRGALLVAPSDPEAPDFPTGPTGFTPMPLRRLPFASVVAASDDDPRISLEGAARYARTWGSRFVNVGTRGHINGASGLGIWPEGLALLAQL
jgi:predicted alpha/beta hydrolase family esterase